MKFLSTELSRILSAIFLTAFFVACPSTEESHMRPDLGDGVGHGGTESGQAPERLNPATANQSFATAGIPVPKTVMTAARQRGTEHPRPMIHPIRDGF